MKSAAKIGNHPIHPMLVLVPAGTFIATLVFDIVYLISDNSLWWQATIPAIIVGLVGGVIAGIPGLIDYVKVARKQNASGIGLAHMLLNITLLVLFLINLLGRTGAAAAPAPEGTYTGFWLSLIGVAILLISGWLGGTMVYEHHVGVLEHPEAKDIPPPEARPKGMAAD